MIRYNFYKDWIFINLFNVISFNWERRKILKSIKNSPFIYPKCYFKFTKDYAPFMFNCHYGKLLSITIKDLEWKDKWSTPRHEENPFISIAIFNKFFFNWEWKLPENEIFKWSDNDQYWEQILWYLYYASYNKEKKDYDELDINKAKESWPWQDCETKKSSWNDKFLIKNEIY